MVIEARPASSFALRTLTKTKVTVFHCFNAVNSVSFPEGDNYEIKGIKLPCSNMTREVVILKAFEAGADAVVFLVCPEGSCRYLEGNIRARKRVTRMKKLLDEIGLDGRRLNIFNVNHGDQTAVNRIIGQTIDDLTDLGPSPANQEQRKKSDIFSLYN